MLPKIQGRAPQFRSAAFFVNRRVADTLAVLN